MCFSEIVNTGFNDSAWLQESLWCNPKADTCRRIGRSYVTQQKSHELVGMTDDLPHIEN